MKKEIGMNDLHETARRLSDRERVEGLAPEERCWLSGHLESCEQCSAKAAETEAALHALKSFSVVLPRGLAASTNLRVREEAAKIRQRRARNLALIAGCTASWVAGVASAPLIWKLFERFGTALDLPRMVWVAGFFGWWLVPAAAASVVILWASARDEREYSNGLVEMGPRADDL